MTTILKINVLALLIITSGLGSCKTYYIPKDSFVKQFSGIDSSRLRNVTMAGVMGLATQYKANPVDTIKCVDKKGMPAELHNGPSIETRITVNNKKRVVLYFDRIIVHDSIVYGIRSRLIGLKTSIPLKDITKIEVQDGGKNYYYMKVEQ